MEADLAGGLFDIETSRVCLSNLTDHQRYPHRPVVKVRPEKIVQLMEGAMTWDRINMKKKKDGGRWDIQMSVLGSRVNLR